MRPHPTALAWINHAISPEPTWDRAQVQRLARHLGFRIVWTSEISMIPLVDQVRTVDVDALITPSPAHLDALTLNSIMSIADVETVFPRMSFARWIHLC